MKIRDMDFATQIDQERDTNFEGERILLAEDNEINALLAVTLMKQWGLNVDHAVNGLEAVKAAKANTYRLIIMDIQMPVLDGVAATYEIKTVGLNKETPIIALTANVRPDQVKVYMQSGILDVIAKPFEANELKRIIKKIFAKKYSHC